MIAMLFSFSGRLNRLKYWLINWGMAGAIAIAIAIAIYLSGSNADLLGRIIAGAIFAAILVCSASINVRRLHDRDKSGLWLLPFCVVPALLAGAGSSTGSAGAEALLSLPGAVLGLWSFIEIGVLRGTRGRNRFGDDPLQ